MTNNAYLLKEIVVMFSILKYASMLYRLISRIQKNILYLFYDIFILIRYVIIYYPQFMVLFLKFNYANVYSYYKF